MVRLAPNRVKISVTVAPELLRAVDGYLEQHPELDRSKAVDEALGLWCARLQERAMEAQFSAPVSTAEEAERAAWKHIQRAATQRTFGLGL